MANMTKNHFSKDVAPPEENKVTIARPVTRRFLEEERRLQNERETQEREPRRSNRDHNVSPRFGDTDEARDLASSTVLTQ